MRPIERMDLGNLFEMELNGKTVKVQVTAMVYNQEENYSDVFEEPCPIDYESFFVRVVATALNCSGEDSVGFVLAKTLEDITDSIADNNMVENAIKELQKEILDQIETLKPYMAA